MKLLGVFEACRDAGAEVAVFGEGRQPWVEVPVNGRFFRRVRIARQVVEAAEGEARRMRLEVEDFCDQRLASFEIILDKLSRTVAVGREKLSGRALAEQREPEPEDPSVAFFDQDAV